MTQATAISAGTKVIYTGDIIDMVGVVTAVHSDGTYSIETQAPAGGTGFALATADELVVRA